MVDPDELLHRLLSVESQAALEVLVADAPDEIAFAFPQWTTLPEDVRADPAAADHWAKTMIAVARALDRLGRPGPLQLLTGAGPDDISSDWLVRFSRSRAAAAMGRTAESIEVLTGLRRELEDGPGPGPVVDDLLPRVYGALASDHLDQGEAVEAIAWTERALTACRSIGDREGIGVYRENLQVLRALHQPTVDAEGGARLLECRRLVVEAQVASDGFRYRESVEKLDTALALVADDPDPTNALRRDYAGKILGLRGWNHYHLGDDEAARRDTERAVVECSAAQDDDGVRVYEANLFFIDRRQAAGRL